MRRIVLPICSFLLAASSLCSQDADVRGEFSIAGGITNTLSGEPVKYALVWATAQTIRKSALADATGNFRMENLPAGEYRLEARKPGHEPPADPVTATVGPSRVGVALKLSPLGVIHGLVLDRDGDPVPGVLVEALESSRAEGRRRLRVLRSVTTNDKGEYRMWNFAQGAYLLKAAGRQGMAAYIGERGPGFSASEAFAPTYFGGGASSSTATPIKIGPGTDFRADVSVNIQPSHRIRGTIANLVRYRAAKIELLSGGEDVGANRVSLNIASGQFQVMDVVDGTYRLRVTQEKDGEEGTRTRAEQEVTVAGADLSDVRLTLSGGVPVRGTVRFEGRQDALVLRLFSVTLYPTDEPPRFLSRTERYSARVDEQGRFEIPSVVQGRYRLEAEHAPRAFVASIVAGNEDLLARTSLDVNPASPPPPIEIVLNGDAGSVAGSLPTGQTAKDLVAVLVPESPGRAPLSANAVSGGKVWFQGVAPGGYRLHAWERDTAPEYAEPEVVRILSASGQRVEVSAGNESTVELKGLSEARQ